MGILPEYPIPDDLRKVLNNELFGTKSDESQVYIKVLNIWKEAKIIDITQNHYFQLLKMALYLEEYHCELDMKQYDLFDKTVFKTGIDTFRFSIDDWFDDEKPMMGPGALIDITDTTNNNFYTLRIVKVDKKSFDAICDELLDVYCEKTIYNVQFRYNNYPMRCRHYALWLAYQLNVINYLFPSNLMSSLNTTAYDSTKLKFFNSIIKSNSKQVEAVLNIVHKSSYPYPYILYGPPGTGKTATVVESICQIVQNLKNRVLVCTPSNTAADEVTRRLLDYINPKLLYRIYSKAQDPLTIDQTILPCCNCEEGKITFVKYEEIAGKRILITTLCNCIRLLLMGWPTNHFSHVIIDEAGHSLEPDILIPVSLVSGNGRIYSQIVLAGDPKQLGPTVMSRLADNVLGRSILERLMSYPIYEKKSNGSYDPKYITKLLDNYRSHPDIIRISNELFYNNELIPKITVECDLFPVAFYSVWGNEQKYSNSTSSFNYAEVHVVMKLIEHIVENKEAWGLDKDFQKDIGIVTPFTLQKKHIMKRLQQKDLKNISVGTVELFQGQEKKIIIISTVRTKIFGKGEDEHIGSLSNPKRFNVAVTRAKSRLIVVGNPQALQTDPSWRYLMKYCIDNNSYLGDDFDLNSGDDGENRQPFGISEIKKSSDLFKWNKFKIFKLDKSDSKTDVIETRRMILHEEMKPVQEIHSITSVQSTPIHRRIKPSQGNHSIPSVSSIQSTPISEMKPTLMIESDKPKNKWFFNVHFIYIFIFLAYILFSRFLSFDWL